MESFKDRIAIQEQEISRLREQLAAVCRERDSCRIQLEHEQIALDRAAQLARRDRLLSAVALFSQMLVQPGSLDENVPKALRALLDADGISRVIVGRNEETESGELINRYLWEQTLPGVPLQKDTPGCNPVHCSDFPELVAALGERVPYYQAFPEDMGPVGWAIQTAVEAKACLMVPIFLGEQWWGVVGFDNCIERRAWTEQEIQVLQGVAAGISAAIAREHAKREVRVAEATIAMERERAAQERAVELARANEALRAGVLEERNRLAREIHDTLAQGFTGVIVQLNAADRIFNEAPDAARKHVHRAIELARTSLNEARRSVQALRPSALEESDLCAALVRMLEAMTAGVNLKAEFRMHGTPQQLTQNMSTELLRVGQEAITNVLRHAEASQVLVEIIWMDAGGVKLRVLDDGRGFDSPSMTEGFGLIGMRERAERLSGRLEIHSRVGGGTEIIFEIPFTATRNNSQEH